MSRLALLLCLVSVSFASAQPAPLPKVPAGFTVELVLQAPDIEAPTALCVAANGDVYYAEDPMDMRGPTTKNIDKIWMLKGGDPKKKILVAEQMWAVMGLEIVRDKLFVVHPPYVTVFTLDVEGKPTGREDLFTDLGPKVAGLPSFNDHVCSGIRMGADGWLYVSIGDKGIPAMTRKEKDKGSVHVAEGRWRHTKDGNVISLEGGGVIRFRPDGSGLEVFASGARNHLDVPLDQHDRIFVRDNTNDGGGWNTRLMYLPRGGFLGYPWAFTQRVSEVAPLIHDFGGGSPCGGWVYLDDGLPETYRGRVFHCEWGKGKVYAVKMKPRGANFDFDDEIKFLDPDGTAVKDFRPFTLRPTADGRGFYVTDWANSGWTNKTVAGRLWKVTYTGTDTDPVVKPAPRIDTTKANLDVLAAALSHPAHSQRIAAQRELIARATRQPREVEQELSFVLKFDVRPYLHAVWVDAARPDGGAVAVRLLSHTDPAVRIEAVRALGGLVKVGNQDVAALLTNRGFIEPAPAVRLQILAALRGRELPQQLATSLFFSTLNQQDPTIQHLTGRYLREDRGIRKPLLEAVKTLGGPDGQAEQTAKTLCWLFSDSFDADAVEILVKLLKHAEPTVRAYAVETLQRNYKDRKLSSGNWWGTRPEQRPAPVRDVAWAGTPTVRDAVISALADRDADVRKTAVRVLGEMRDPETLEPLKKRLGEEKETPAKIDLVRALASLKTPADSAEYLRTLAGFDGLPVTVRVAALAGLDSGLPKTAEFLAAFLAPATPVELQVAALNALARLKSPQAGAMAVRSLPSPEASVRKAALAALALDASQGKAIRPLLNDPDPAVKLAAIQTLGTIRDRDSVPALLEAIGPEATSFDAVLALTRMPDRRAVSAYLLGLGSKNVPLRQASAVAIAAIRDEAAPILEQLVKRSEVPATLLPELRTIYSSFEPIASWAIIGPFPDNGKEHVPPKEINLDAKIDGLAWRKDRKGDLKAAGKINLASLLGGKSDVVAYAYAEIDSPTDRAATLQIGSDDTMQVWLNGEKVFEFTGSRGWSADSNRANVRLKKGKNTLLIQCGNKSGPWEFSVATSVDASKYAFLQGGGGKLDLEAYRTFARKTTGDAERGRKLYLDVKGLACAKCHTLANDGGKVGPALDDVGLKYKREEIMTSILEPSRTIANGYESLAIELKTGKVIVGVSRGEQDGAVLLVDDDAKLHTIKKSEIEELTRSPVSRMPNGLNEGMSLQDFADVIAFLETCRQEKPK